MKVQKFEGSPIEFGAHIWHRFCLPAIKASAGLSPKERMKMYVGFVSSCFVAVVADVGHEEAVKIFEELTGHFSTKRNELPGPTKQ